MKNFILVLLVLVFVGCGGNTVKDENPPTSPESLNSPPSIPNI